jgi:beta-1,4-mannosyl-glycoprotein beta-1,4-N-acetylglucosaminyltransferase
MLYDCFLFAGEWLQLHIRLHELEGLVDQFVMVESAWDHQGNPRTLEFREREREYQRWPIRLVEVETPVKEGSPPWDLAFGQRRVLYDALASCDPADTILISDVDEIPRRAAVEQALTMEAAAFHQKLYYYYLNWEKRDEQWWGTRAYKKRSLPKSMRVVRGMGNFMAGERPIEDAGWHFTWLGGPDAIRHKIRTFSDTWLNSPHILDGDYIETCLKLHLTVHSQGQLEVVAIDETYPRYVQEKRESLERFLR